MQLATLEQNLGQQAARCKALRGTYCYGHSFVLHVTLNFFNDGVHCGAAEGCAGGCRAAEHPEGNQNGELGQHRGAVLRCELCVCSAPGSSYIHTAGRRK